MGLRAGLRDPCTLIMALFKVGTSRVGSSTDHVGGQGGVAYSQSAADMLGLLDIILSNYTMNVQITRSSVLVESGTLV